MKSKVVPITGADSGVRAASALLLADRGAKVVLGPRLPRGLGCARRNPSRVDAKHGDGFLQADFAVPIPQSAWPRLDCDVA